MSDEVHEIYRTALDRLERKWRRERESRKAAERLLEQRSAALWKSNEALRELTANLEDRVGTRSRALEEARVEAEAANEAKSRFLARLSHELRTPLAAVLGYAELLREPSHGEMSRRGFIDRLEGSARHLLGLLDDLLDVSRIDAGQLLLSAQPTTVGRVVAEVLAMVEREAASKRLSLDTSIDDPNARLHVDTVRLRQVLGNLVQNAVKYTDSGRVHLRARVMAAEYTATEGRPALPRRLVVEVEDTGPGIARADLARIFQPFRRAEAAERADAKGPGGTGLGLAIARELTRLMGGDLTVDTKLGRGSIFRAVVAAPTPPAGATFTASDGRDLGRETAGWGAPLPESAGEVEVAERSLRVLVVDDQRELRDVFSFFLQMGGCDVTLAEGGQEGLDAIAAAMKHHDPAFDCVLLDMQMPGLDGYATVARLRAGGYTAPVIALTAHALAGDRERCLAAGCDDYLSKPIGKDDLVRAVRDAARGG